MTWIIGREPGYPQTTQVADLSTGHVTTTTEDRYKVETPGQEIVLSETILNGLPSSLALGSRLGSCGLKSRTAVRNDSNRTLWHLSLSYSSEMDEQTSQDQTQPPDMRRVKYNWDFETRDILFTKDVVTGDAVANSVGEPFELTTEYVIAILNINTYRRTFSPNTILNFTNRTNQNAFWGFPAKSAAIAGIRDSEDAAEVWQGARFRQVQYVVKFMIPNIPDVIEGWKEIIMNRGSFYREGGVDKPFTAQGSRIIGKLDAAGGKLAAGAQPVFLKFNRLVTADFRDLGIDIDQLRL